MYPFRPRAHERVFAAAVKQPQRPSISWLCSRTVKETLRSHIFLTVCQCVQYGFCRVGCCVRSSATNQDKEKKEVLDTSICKSKTTEGQCHKLYEDLRIHPKKFFGYFRMTCSSFDELSSMIGPKITYRNTMMRASVPPEERLAVTLR